MLVICQNIALVSMITMTTMTMAWHVGIELLWQLKTAAMQILQGF